MSWKHLKQTSLADALFIEHAALTELDGVHNIYIMDRMPKTGAQLVKNQWGISVTRLNSNLTTLIRTIVILAVIAGIVALYNEWQKLVQISLVDSMLIMAGSVHLIIAFDLLMRPQ